jgi:hypothetical protein
MLPDTKRFGVTYMVDDWLTIQNIKACRHPPLADQILIEKILAKATP